MIGADYVPNDKFADNLKATDKKLLDCLPADKTIDPWLQETLRKAGVSLREQDHLAAIMTLLKKQSTNVQISLATESISRL